MISVKLPWMAYFDRAVYGDQDTPNGCYDGNPTIAQIRIATGAMGEDNPIVGVPGHPWPGYAEAQWLDFSRRVLQIYFAAFHGSELQFDLTRLCYMWGSAQPDGKAAIDAFIDELFRHHVMLAFA